MLELYPIYKKTNCHFLKIISENKAVMITSGGEYTGYGIQKQGYIIVLESFEKSNESEFLDAYDYVRNKLDEVAL